MKISIENIEYNYNFIGEPIKLIDLKDYSLKEEDVLCKKNYDILLQKYTEKIDNIETNIIFAIGGLIYICEVIAVIQYNSPHIKFDNIFATLCLLGGVILAGIPLSGWQGGIISAFLPKSLLGKAANMFVQRPHKPEIYEQVARYQEALKENDKILHDLSLKYYGLSSANYDLSQLGADKIQCLVSLIIKYINLQNGIITKDNLRKEQQYWYNLDPFEFEEEVAYWFTQQGYKSSVTSKTGDGGIDVIIKKGDYIGYVQCKRYTNSKVDRPTLNALYGVVCADGATQGIIVSLEGVTNEAKEFAKRTNIRIVCIDDLAPKEDLFHHVIKEKTLSLTPQKQNDSWCNIGNVFLNTNCFRTMKDLQKFVTKFDNNSKYHPIEYWNLFYLIYCDDNVSDSFTTWLKNETSIKTSSSNKTYRKKRKRR